MKKIFIIIGVILLVLFAFWKLKPTPVVKSPDKTVASCHALTIISPQKNEQVTRDFTIKAIVNNSNSACHWAVFEAQAGTIEIKDSNNTLVATSTLKTTDNWMTNNPVTYTGAISLDANTPHGYLTLFIHEESPNGNPGKTVSVPLQY